MAFSLFLLAFIYYPLIGLYIFPSKPDSSILKDNFYIEIPKINVLSKVIEDVDSINESVYIKELEKGVAQAKGTSLPDEKGSMFLFAHSSDAPWRITKYNTAFFRLPELKEGDDIKIGYKGKIYKYKVTDAKTVWPEEIQYLQNVSGERLILQTCVPVGTSLKRLLVFAKPSQE